MKHSIFKHTIAVFCVVIVVAAAAATVGGYLYNSGNTANRAEYYALTGSATAISVMSNMDYDEFSKSDKTELYADIRNELKSICDAFMLEYLYVYEIIPESDSIRYITCVSSDDEKNELVSRERGFGKIVKHTLTEQEKNAIKNVAYDTPYHEKNKFGEVYTWVYPLVEDGEIKALVGSDYRVNDLEGETIRAELITIIPMIVILILAFFFALLSMRKKIFIPIKRLSVCMNSFMTDGGADLKSLNIDSDNEIGEMASSFIQMSDEIKNYLSNIESLTAERERAKVELDVARRIQSGIVPVESAISDDGYDVFACARPAREVGGDFYDCFKTSSGKICTVMGDVSGKGIAAAMFMAMTKTMLHDRLNSDCDPAEVLNYVNESLCASNPEGMFVTVFAAVLDPKTGEVCYANAGHTPPVIIGENASFLEVDSGIAIGLFEDACIEDNYMTLKDGEGILLYTDGVTDAINHEKSFFGDKRIIEAVKNADGAESAIKLLGRAVSDFVSGAEQFDDYTTLAVFYSDGFKKTLNLSPNEASLPELRGAILNITGNTPTGRKIYLACDEAFVNIISYSGASRVSVRLEKHKEIFKVAFTDDGTPFDPTSQLKQKDFNEFDGGGMGLALIRQISDEISYAREDGNNILTLTFCLTPQ